LPSNSPNKELFLFLFRFLRLADLLRGKCLDSVEFLLKTGGEIMGSVFEEDNKTKGKENEEGDPKKSAQERHARSLTEPFSPVN
jgi:hypothetical protein